MNKENINTEAVFDEDDSMVVVFAKPYKFEGNEYTQIDMSALYDLTAADMIAINSRRQRMSQGIEVMPEITMEYACELAARACKKPLEFFTRMPLKDAVKVKNRVVGFLFS